jgi:hypothetical protein
VVITDAPSHPPPPFMASEEFKQRQPPPRSPSEKSSSDDDDGSSSDTDDADEITRRMHAERSAVRATYDEALQVSGAMRRAIRHLGRVSNRALSKTTVGSMAREWIETTKHAAENGGVGRGGPTQAFQQGRWRDAKAGLLHAHTLCEPLADVAVQADCDRMIGGWALSRTDRRSCIQSS